MYTQALAVSFLVNKLYLSTPPPHPLVVYQVTSRFFRSFLTSPHPEYNDPVPSSSVYVYCTCVKKRKRKKKKNISSSCGSGRVCVWGGLRYRLAVYRAAGVIAADHCPRWSARVCRRRARSIIDPHGCPHLALDRNGERGGPGRAGASVLSE